jgi:hypothetical protein
MFQLIFIILALAAASTHLATAIANAVWLLGDAVGHIHQMTANNNHAANNSGIFLIAEIVTPIAILLLTLYNRKTTGRV